MRLAENTLKCTHFNVSALSDSVSSLSLMSVPTTAVDSLINVSHH